MFNNCPSHRENKFYKSLADMQLSIYYHSGSNSPFSILVYYSRLEFLSISSPSEQDLSFVNRRKRASFWFPCCCFALLAPDTVSAVCACWGLGDICSALGISQKHAVPQQPYIDLGNDHLAATPTQTPMCSDSVSTHQAKCSQISLVRGT